MSCFLSFPSTVYDLLTSPDCLPDLLQGGLVEQGVDEAFILTSFKLQPKTGTSVFGLYNPRDNSKYFEFTVMGKLNRGGQTRDVPPGAFRFKHVLTSTLLHSEKRVRKGQSYRV